jgi:hypothetical protein
LDIDATGKEEVIVPFKVTVRVIWATASDGKKGKKEIDKLLNKYSMAYPLPRFVKESWSENLKERVHLRDQR